MKKLLSLHPHPEGLKLIQQVKTETGVYVGSVYVEVDGFWVFQQKDRGGFLSEDSLQEILDLLRGLNAEYRAELERYFNSQNQLNPKP